MLNFHKDLRSLVIVSFLGFLILSLGVAVFPAYQMQEENQPLPDMKPMTEAQTRGLHIFIREGCVACHTQQVRNIEMDKTWGSRPSIPSDYYYSKQRLDVWRQSPSLLGSERTGPDLTNVGARKGSKDWQLLHLYDPRIVVEASIMPSYAWLFRKVDKPAPDDVVLAVPDKFLKGKGKIVATQDALDLTEYLLSLKQAPLPSNEKVEFIPAKKKEEQPSGKTSGAGGGNELPDGAALYMSTCSACHQAQGTGLPGAFPPLAGSTVVNDKDPKKHISIILEGYDALPQYGQMPSFANQLSDKEIAAIANHERTSWGNNGPTVTEEDVKKIRASVASELP